MATSAELIRRTERLMRLARRSTPTHAAFALDLCDLIEESGLATDTMKVHDSEIRTQQGPLGGVSTRIPVSYTDPITGHQANVMITIYADHNIDAAFRRLGLLD